MIEFFRSQMDYIFFIYGMSFFVLAVSAFFLYKSKNKDLPWLWLFLFGLVHTVNEWLDLTAISIGDNLEFKFVRLIFLIASFIFLANFFLSSLKIRREKYWLLILWVLVVYLGWHFSRISGLNFTARYFLGCLGGLGAGVVLIWKSWKIEKPQSKYLRLTGIVFGLYALTQLVIANPPGLLATTLLNQENFFNFFKFPIQFLRCLLAFLLAVFLLSFGYLYNKSLVRNIDYIRHMRKVIFAVLIYLVLVVIGGLITEAVYFYELEKSKNDLIAKVNTAAGPINYKRIATLSASLADSNSPDFIRLKEELEAFNKANPSIKYAYLMRFKDNKIVFLVDATLPTAADYAPAGQVYEEAVPELRNKFFSAESFVSAPYTDQWGTWVSAYAPIFDKETEAVVARIGLDVDINTWQHELLGHRLFGILISFVLFIFFISFYIINRVNSIARQEILTTQKELEIILDSVKAWIFYKNKDNQFIRVNQAFADAVGMPREALEGKYLDALYPKEIADKFWEADNEIILSKKPKLNIIEFIDTINGRIWLQTDKYPYVNERGKIIGVVGLSIDITERRRLEKAVWDSEDKFRTLVSNVPGAIYRCKNDLGWSMEFISYAIRDICGYPASDFIKNKTRTYESIIYEADRSMVRETVESAVNKSEPYQIEYRIVHSDGSLRWVTETGQGVFGESGLLWLDGAIFDFTARKQAEKIIQENEDKISLLLNSVAEAIYGLDLNGNCTFCNNACLQVLGYKHENELLGKNMHWLIHGKHADGRVLPIEDCRIFKAFQQGTGTHVDDEVLWRADGTFFPAEYWSYPQFHDGVVVGAVVTFLNISERKQILENLKYATLEWQRTFDSMSDLVFILDKEFTIVKANKTCFEMLKLKPQEMIGKKCFEVIHGLNNAWPNCPFEQTCLDEKIHTEEVVDPRLGGITLLVTTSPIFKANGEFIGAIHIAKDITDIKKYQTELENKNKELEKLDQLKSEFVSVVSHELRTPLSIIKEGISLVLDKIPGEINPKQDRILSTSKDNIDRLARIINNLLDISKIESGKVELRKKLVDINNLVSKVMHNFELKAKEKGIDIILKLPPGKLNVLIDEDRIFEVFTNLVNNSLKFTEKGFVEIEIVDLGNEVKCQIKDSGIGVHTENLSKLFVKFVQFSRIDGGGEKGTGLGLSIAKGFVELHGGRIWAESEFGHGMSIYFSLPKNI